MGTPHQVHFFKNIIYQLEKKGHQIKIIGRDKDCELELLKIFFKDYELVEFDRGIYNKIFGMFITDYMIYKIVQAFQPDIMLGTLPVNLAHVGTILGIPVIAITDTEHASLIINLTIPFCVSVITSSSYTKNHGNKHIRFDGYNELAYLHPNYFKPDLSVLDFLHLKEGDKYVIMRFVSWDASHDLGHSGLTLEMKRKAVSEFSKYGKVFITSEAPLPRDLEKYRIKLPFEMIHNALYYATLFFGDGGTMTSESAVLGTPAVFISSLTTGYLIELEREYELIFRYNSDEKSQFNAIKKGLFLLRSPEIKKDWKRRRQRLLNSKVDVTDFIVKSIESFIL